MITPSDLQALLAYLDNKAEHFNQQAAKARRLDFTSATDEATHAKNVLEHVAQQLRDLCAPADQRVGAYQLQTWSEEQQSWVVSGEWWPHLERVAVDVWHASKAGQKCRIAGGPQCQTGPDIVTVTLMGPGGGPRTTMQLPREDALTEVSYSREHRVSYAVFINADCVYSGWLSMDELTVIGKELTVRFSAPIKAQTT